MKLEVDGIVYQRRLSTGVHVARQMAQYLDECGADDDTCWCDGGARFRANLDPMSEAELYAYVRGWSVYPYVYE